MKWFFYSAFWISSTFLSMGQSTSRHHQPRRAEGKEDDTSPRGARSIQKGSLVFTRNTSDTDIESSSHRGRAE